MIPLSGAALREAFLTYFEATLATEGFAHRRQPSASLVPANPTVLLTPAGMLPFVPLFLGIEPPPNPPRVVSVQKCARVSGKASDLSYVGRTSRHHTFFEMLGNFSFGDYFKAQIIPWAWTFVTTVLKIPADKLWVSVYQDDNEAAEIWHTVVGLPKHKIVYCGKKDNFWGPPGPTGPCGPCSEIYFDRGAAYGGAEGDLEADRYVEIWNLVFMELFQDADGQQTPLDKKNVDTGMGLERLAMVVQNKANTFETDLLYPILDRLSKHCGIAYKQHPDTDLALKIVTDHARCVVFALADGIIPSNEGRGYIIRMILRRAVRTGKSALGQNAPFLHQLVAVIRDLYQATYPDLKGHYNRIVETIKQEEERFFQTLERGSRLLDEVIAEAKVLDSAVVSGDAVFKLYDTFGFPKELTEDVLQEHGLTFNEADYQTAMLAQKTLARGARKGHALVQDQVFADLLTQVGATRFVGYDDLNTHATVKALLVDGQTVASVSGTNQPFVAILDCTPFYAESGGQVGDRGAFSLESGPNSLTVVVNDTTKVGDLILHHCLFDQGGQLAVGDTVLAQVEPVYRQLSAVHHTSTHLLQAALRKVLGNSVSQAGSQVGPDGARFDFTFNRALKPDELGRVEQLINRWITENVSRDVAIMDMDAAKASGALLMADETYGDAVRVVGYGVATKELCGGTHVGRLGDIGLVKIVSEGAIASGVRRIELVAGEKAYKLFRQSDSLVQQLAHSLKVSQKELPEKLDKLQDTLKQRDKTIQQLEERLALGVVHQLLTSMPKDHAIIAELESVASAEALKFVAERLKAQRPHIVIVLGASIAGKAHVLAVVPEALTKQGIKAGDLVKQVAEQCGGSGGGKPTFAQAGGKDPQHLHEALEAINVTLTQQMEATVSS
jgi:alanyl-tRNA synthetase